jgi:predicted MFS family arabinose efflux permease
MKTTDPRVPTPARGSQKIATGWLTTFVIGSDLFVVSPLLPLIASDYKIEPALAGLSVTIFSITYMLSAPFLGHLADRIGHARLLVYCLVAFACANLMTAVCASFTWLLVARLTAGAAAAGVTPSIYALIGANAPSDQRATWLAVTVSGLLMSLSFGAPLGLMAGTSLGWPIVFAGLGALSLFLVCANSRVWRNKHAANGSVTPAARLGRTAVVRRLAPTVIWSTAVYTMYTYLGSGLTSLGLSTDKIAEMIVFYGCGAITGVLIGGRLTDRFGPRATSTVSLAGLGFCFILLYLALDLEVLARCALALLSAVAQLFFPAQQIRLANEFPGHRATVLAWNNSALFLGISLGSVIGGQAISLGGFSANLMISAAIAFAGWGLNSAGRLQLASVLRHRCTCQ